MRKAIAAIVLSAASVAFGFALAGTGESPAAVGIFDADVVGTTSESMGTEGSAGDFVQVQDESPGPGGTREHNCPDRDGDGEPDAREDSRTSLEQV